MDINFKKFNRKKCNPFEYMSEFTEYLRQNGHEVLETHANDDAIYIVDGVKIDTMDSDGGIMYALREIERILDCKIFEEEKEVVSDKESELEYEKE